MPESKKRPHHAHPQTPHKHNTKGNNRVVMISVIFFALIGFGIAFFGAGTSTIFLLLGAAAGAVCGYFFGHAINRSLLK